MKKIKTFLLFLIVFLLSPSLLVSAVESNYPLNYLSTDGGNKIGIGIPQTQVKVGKYLIIYNSTSASKNTVSNDTLIYDMKVFPTNYTSSVYIPLEFLKGESLSFHKDNKGKNLNYGNILNKDLKSIGLIYIDGINKDKVNIDYENRGFLKLNIDYKNIKTPIEFQIKINTTNFSTYFYNSSWLSRGGLDSLSFIHKDNVINTYDSKLEIVRKIDMWDKVLMKHSNDLKWSNPSGLKNQFYCHVDFAKDKADWNIEPSRKNVDYLSTIISSCNP